MRVEPFDIEVHFGTLLSMLHKRKAYIPTKAEMPAVGFMVFDGDTPVSYASLRRIEGGSAMFDGLTSNPDCSPEQRHVGNDLAIKTIIEAAKYLNIKHLVAFTADNSTLMRSIRHGFVEVPHTCVILDTFAKERI